MDSPMMVPCDQVISKLWEYLDGALDESRAARIREHLEMCARCLPQYNFELAFLALLKRNSSQAVPASLRRKVFEALLESNAIHPGAQPSIQASLRSWLQRAWRTFKGGRSQ